MSQICQNIKEAREAKKWSQQKLSDELGIERSTYKNWEYTTEPPLSIIKTIAEKLEIPAYKLLEGVIDFSEALVPRPKMKIETAISAEEYDRIRFSLSILDSIFSRAVHSGKDSSPGVAEVRLSDKIESHQKTGKKKDKQKGISI